MSWFPHVSNVYFAAAGLICAAGPVVIHLLNRRRSRLVQWAAMDFLFEALQRQKRRLQLRDVILLVLRTAAVLFFGLALARPYLNSDLSHIGASSPRHLIVLLDNSLSMGYRQIDQTLFEQAKQHARRLIESLPDGSQVTVIGTNGQRDFHRGPIRKRADALESLAAVQLVDGAAKFEKVLTAARTATGTAGPLADQIVYFTDLQRNNWPTEIDSSQVEQLPAILIRDMSNRNGDNAWVGDIRLRDNIVDLDSPATVFVTVRHHGERARRTHVSLELNSQIVASRGVELPPGHAERQIAFRCSFSDAPVEPGNATYVPLRVSLAPDRLEQDDQQTVLVPVVTSLPVVFVDQYNDEDEDPAWGQLGETRPLRHLLAPRPAGKGVRPLVDVHHTTLSQVDRSLLANARLVVVAGVADPAPTIEALQWYVRQGGPLVVAAGGNFDPVAWNLAAGQDGVGLLPGHLAEQPLGATPDETGDDPLVPFSLSFESLALDTLFRLPGLSDSELRALYREPLFFKSVVLSGDEPGEPLRTPHAQVCARFTDPQGTPFLARHRCGKGDVLFVTTSILPTWNNLAQTNAIVLWDHILRSLIRSTLPQRNYVAQHELAIAVPARKRGAAVHVQRPQTPSVNDTINVGFVEKDRLGVTIPNAWTRGLYRLTSADQRDNTGRSATRFWQIDVAVQGDPTESDLTPLSTDDIQERIVDTGVGRLFTGDSLGALEGAANGNALWWWLVLAVFALLAGESVLLALSNRNQRVAAASELFP